MKNMKHLVQYANYVRNTNGGATKEHFIDDWEPFGDRLWLALKSYDFVEIRDGKIFLTDKGNKFVDSRS